MFERTSSLWRRLTGKKANGPARVAVQEDERRVWVRHPSNIETRFTPVGEEADCLPGRIRDISLGGVKLIVNRREEPGTLITVNLPGNNGQPAHSVLACVVHCQDIGNGEFALGCNFSQELSDEDLVVFGARKVRSKANHDGRNWTRFACDVEATCQIANDDRVPAWTSKVLNISASGMGLLAPHDIPTGTLLSVELHKSLHPQGLTILACVVHITLREDGQRIIGCNFIRELNEEDLKVMV